MIKILISDGMEKIAVDKLVEDGFEVIDKHYDEEELKEQIKNFDVIVVRSATKIRKSLIDIAKGGRLKLIIRGGVGLDNIDVEYARENGIQVNNTPNASTVSVAEMTIAHMLTISRYVSNSNITMRQGKWEKKKYKGVELYGKTLGLIGFGRIAKEVAKRAYAMGMKVIYYDKLGKAKGYNDYTFYQLNDLLKKADYISVHIPFGKNNRAVIGKEQFNIMKDGVYIINCARGGVIDEIELVNALNSGKVAGAGIDVFCNEPEPNQELVNNERVSVTPHIAGSTKEAQQRIGIEIVNIVENFFSVAHKKVINE
ncbi:MAG: D-2-hydroxyacid dehydrogenase [Clostridium sp.]|uniref:D-2-hydroxyacid dehydrogenase n=1 Tax=Clostridium sp. TaxID=1506 RepID=UPI0025BD2662|nr:D-2-hydroxyacid dehydrogenase [Clostridium sp.]MCH3965425.1 D-2-hydroxyacid dehydrogenase [Clostridium sp.]MCI1717294.1 D-2-hydroxyacid dehydrogenase [Clostridium sp.]MCI1801634.1 D-2-hydroxyacid dehydrogenase [Clostridium sp.]MCI1815480.1 D-2-hydroxyacid dehydrogenase [Clostridium sp.]MCI1872383.1 D-2-hydroxyacid dehydrogenase [Clostridium sp.]